MWRETCLDKLFTLDTPTSFRSFPGLSANGTVEFLLMVPSAVRVYAKPYAENNADRHRLY